MSYPFRVLLNVSILVHSCDLKKRALTNPGAGGDLIKYGFDFSQSPC